MTHSTAARGVAAFLAAAVALLAAGPVYGSATDVDAAACCKRHEPCSSTAAGDSAKPDPFRCCIGERSRLTGTLPCADAPAPLDRPLAGDIFEFPPGPLYALTSTYRI